jgi:phosphohistidine phosphatase
VSGLIDGGGADCVPVYDRRVYNASTGTLIEVIREADDKVERLLLVGHNPGLHNLVQHLADNDADGLRGHVALSFPTATLAAINLSIDNWQDVAPQCGRIVKLIRPDD